jgi:hypothetical protein
MGGMEKTTVYLKSAQKAALGRAAAATGRSEADLIRAGIDVMTAGHRVAEATTALEGDAPGPMPPTTSLERPRWVDRAAFIGLIGDGQADAGLTAELRGLAPGTTDDEPVS